MAATRRRGGSRLFRISWWGFAAASPERSATCVTGRSCPLGRSRPPTGVLAVLPPRFVAPGFLPCCSAVRIEGNAAHFGAGDLVAASEVDGTQEALRSGREEGVGGFKRSYGVASPAGAFDEGLEGLPRRRRCRFYEPESDNCALSSWKPASVRPVAASMTSHVTPTRRSPSTISICFRASPSARPFASPSASSCWA